jgi:glucose-specific phosphotransferase system IIA component
VVLKVAAPMAGLAVPLTEVPDRVFAEGIVGPGLAIRPDPGPQVATAPIAGILVKVKPHAYVVVSPAGQAVLVHLGIDTVTLDGAGFTVLTPEGERVASGDPVIAWDPASVVQRGLAPICPVIALEGPTLVDLAAGPVTPGDSLYTWA